MTNRKIQHQQKKYKFVGVCRNIEWILRSGYANKDIDSIN